ncbi:MAG TPA: hypothetical protein VHH12_00945, partial [Mycobacterium sp.]|nr:hypothetical protein [Mycobacterium sp.]
DTPSRYRAFARISGLRGVSFGTDPVAASIDTSSAQVLKLHAETGGVTFDSVIDKLPPHVGFTMTPGAGGSQVIDYNTNGTEIEKITVDATGLPLPNGADKLHAEIEDLPSHMTLTLPASGGTIAFDPHGDHIGRVLAQAYGAAGPATAADGHQLLHYDEAKAQITLDVHNVGALSATQSTSPLNLSYDISSAPLDFGVALSDGTYFNGTISNPQPATVSVDPSDGATAVMYQVQPGGPNFRGAGQIDQIDIYTNAAGGYLEGHLSNVPARLYACVQSETGTRCKPTWVPLTTVADGDTYSVPHPSFAFQLLPTDLNNEVPANRLTLNGIICLDEEDPALCKDASKKNARIVIDDLMFNTVEAAVGHQDEGCDVACGRVWAGFNTEDDPINGRVRYIEQGADDTLVDFRAPNPDSYLAANRKFYFLHYDIVAFDMFDDASSGSISCGNPRPNLEIEVPGFNPDLLTGNNIPGDGLCG